jgi:DNA-binding MarR family transcriptional regulator
MVAASDTSDEPISAGVLAVAEDIERNPRSPIGDIAERTGLAQSFVSKTVARFRDEGLFVIDQDPNDARRTLVSVAPGTSVTKHLPQSSKPIDDSIRTLFPDASDNQINRILLGLNVLADEVLFGPSPRPPQQRAANDARPAGRVRRRASGR